MSVPDSTASSSPAETIVVDASALVDLLVGTDLAPAVRTRLAGTVWRAPAHLDAEVLSALGRLSRAGRLTDADVDQRLALLGSLPLSRHLVPGLLAGAWTRRADLSLADALYVELAAQLQAPLITTDLRLARATPLAEAITI
jgi:predicted nucleic acid-binding protein